jgi:hypothetical protein
MRYLRTKGKEEKKDRECVVCIKKCIHKFCILSKELTLVLIGTSAVCVRVNLLLFMYLFGSYCNLVYATLCHEYKPLFFRI